MLLYEKFGSPKQAQKARAKQQKSMKDQIFISNHDEIVSGFKNGNMDAFRTIFEANHKAMHYYARQILNESTFIDDIIQASFLMRLVQDTKTASILGSNMICLKPAIPYDIHSTFCAISRR